MRRSFFVAMSLGCALAGGCRKEAAAPPPPPPVAVNAPVAESPPAPELAGEAEGRPMGTPRAEQVFGALESAGQHITSKRQVSGAPVGAHYCVIATTAKGLNLSVCEFDDEAKAVASREASLKAWASIPRRTLVRNRQTLLTVIRPSDEAALFADGEAAQKLFGWLTP